MLGVPVVVVMLVDTEELGTLLLVVDIELVLVLDVAVTMLVVAVDAKENQYE